MPYLIGLSTSCKGRIYQAAQIAEANGNKVANLILAVEKGQDSDGNKLSDFIDCAFWGRDAELIARYPEGHEINITTQNIKKKKQRHRFRKKRITELKV